jgi:hypothetical protein
VSGLADFALVEQVAALSEHAYVLVRRGHRRQTADLEWRVSVRARGQEHVSTSRSSLRDALWRAMDWLRAA